MGLFSTRKAYTEPSVIPVWSALPQAARYRVIIIASSRASRRLAVCFIMFRLLCF